MREQIEWQQQAFSHNQDCLDLIAAKPHGILRILDDQSGFPQVQPGLITFHGTSVSLWPTASRLVIVVGNKTIQQQ